MKKVYTCYYAENEHPEYGPMHSIVITLTNTGVVFDVVDMTKEEALETIKNYLKQDIDSIVVDDLKDDPFGIAKGITPNNEDMQ